MRYMNQNEIERFIMVDVMKRAREPPEWRNIL